MARTVADQFVERPAAAGVKRIYGIGGDSLNGLTDAVRRQGKIDWVHVRHEEVAAFAADAEAHLTGMLAVCADSCGPGNLHLINGLFDCHRSRVPVFGIAAQIPSPEIGAGYARLARAGAKVARGNALLPSLAASARLYMRLLGSAKSASLSPDRFAAAERAEAALSAANDSLEAERTRGTMMSHRAWLRDDLARARLRQQWSLLFRDCDVVLYPSAAVPAFPHDHSLPIEARRIDIDGKAYPYYDACFVRVDPASIFGLPATAAPIDRSPAGLPIGMQIIGPYLEDRTTIAFAELLEREFGGFLPPPGYGGR